MVLNDVLTSPSMRSVRPQEMRAAGTVRSAVAMTDAGEGCPPSGLSAFSPGRAQRCSSPLAFEAQESLIQLCTSQVSWKGKGRPPMRPLAILSWKQGRDSALCAVRAECLKPQEKVGFGGLSCLGTGDSVGEVEPFTKPSMAGTHLSLQRPQVGLVRLHMPTSSLISFAALDKSCNPCESWGHLCVTKV